MQVASHATTVCQANSLELYTACFGVMPRYVYGVPPTNSDMDNADGLTGWIDDLCLDEL